MDWCRPGDKPLSELMMVSLLTHICVTRLQWINVNWTLRNTLYWNFNRNPNIFIEENACQNVICKWRSLCTGFNVPSVRLTCWRHCIKVTSRERRGVPNHQQIDCLFNIIFRLATKKSNKENPKAPHYRPLVRGNHRWLVDSPHKTPVIQKSFPYHESSYVTCTLTFSWSSALPSAQSYCTFFQLYNPSFTVSRSDTSHLKYKQCRSCVPMQ